MAFLTKRGKYYYIKWNTSQNGTIKAIRKALGTQHKDVAQKMLRELEKLESLGKIDTFSAGFDPKRALKLHAHPNGQNQVQCETVKEALELFYRAKQHLSPAIIGAYKRALDHFVDFNDLEDAHPKHITIQHFENIIFKKGISTATRHYYFRHFRTWWNFLKKKKIVERDHFELLKEDMSGIRRNTRPKMISEVELKKLFKVFDRELERKKKLPEFEPDKVQHWFKPVIAVYFYGGLRKHEAPYSPELVYIELPATKGRDEHRVPIIRSLRKYLEDYLKIRGSIKADDYVFIYQGGTSKGQLVRGDRVYREFKRYAKLAGIPSTRNLHGMRHQAVTTWIENGFNTTEHTPAGSLYYPDDWHAYATLILRGVHVVVDRRKVVPRGRAHINGIEGFWSYAKHWLYTYRGVQKDYFPLQQKEIEWRFNHRNENLIPVLKSLTKKTIPDQQLLKLWV